MKRPSGVLTAIITPFKDGRKIDGKRIENVLEHVLRGGVDGLFILGTTGLGPMLGFEERKLVAETVVTTTSARAFKVVHVGGLNMEDVIRLAEHAASVGADAVAALTPFYYKLPPSGVVDYYRELERSTSLPILIYNIPQNTGYNITPAVTAEVVENTERVVGMKDSSGDLSQLITAKNTLTNHEFAVLNGSDSLVLSALASGLDGSVTALSNVIPAVVKSIDEAFRNNDPAKALESQQKVWKLGRAMQHNLIPLIYAVLNNMGVDVGFPPRPLKPAPKEEAERIIKLLRELELA